MRHIAVAALLVAACALPLSMIGCQSTQRGSSTAQSINPQLSEHDQLIQSLSMLREFLFYCDLYASDHHLVLPATQGDLAEVMRQAVS